MELHAKPRRTSDLDAAAYPSLKNVKRLEVERTGPCVTLFEARNAALVADLYSGPTVVAQDYAAQLRAMKRTIFASSGDRRSRP